MSKEVPLQQGMFSHELVDTRSRAQKSRDRASQQLQQVSMFSVRETIQYGVNARPWLKDMAQPTLTLEMQDVRTEEEKEREQRRAAEALTVPLFTGDEVGSDKERADTVLPAPTLSPPAPTNDKVPDLRQVGFRAYARRKSIPVRW